MDEMSYAFCLREDKTKIIIMENPKPFQDTTGDILFSIKQGQSDEVRDLCVVEHSNQVFRAQIQHVGRGKIKGSE